MTLAESQKRGNTSIQVLLIDDDEDAFILTRDLLADVRGPQYVLEWAKTAEAGIAKAESGNFDVCLVDFYLGARKGDAVIAELRRRKSRLPLILMTGDDRLANDLSVTKAGGDGFLIKGETTPILLERTIRFAVERRVQEAELRASESQFRELFLSSLDGVLLTAPNGSVLAANPAAEVLFKMTEAELIKAGRRSLIAAEDDGQMSVLDARLEAGAFRDEISLRRGDKSTFIAEVSMAAIADGGTRGRASMVIRDVSVRRATEQRSLDTEKGLRAVERLEPAGAAVVAVSMILLSVFMSSLAAVAIGVATIGVQAWMLRSYQMRRLFAFTSLADWREHTVDARRRLSRFAEHVRIDPETGLGTRGEMEHAFNRQQARFQQTGETFSLALLEVVDPESPRRELPRDVVALVSKILWAGTTAEDSICRIDINTFGVLLPGCTAADGSQFVEEFRAQLGNKLRGKKNRLKVVGGAAEVSDQMSLVGLLQRASDALSDSDRDLGTQLGKLAHSNN